jgi:chorismate mutase
MNNMEPENIMSPTLVTTRQMVVAGPCSAETPEQIHHSIQEAKQRGVDYVRISLWKPRTKPGFDGLKESGIPLLADAAQMGMNPATEVLVPQQAENIMETVLPALGQGQRLMFWIGARNQNHYVQNEIARVCAQDKRVGLMVKNQPWSDENHWEGIVEHVMASGIEADNVVICHRGFMPGGNNPMNLRNVPDHEMSMRLKEKSGLKMILDLSHTGGHPARVMELGIESTRYDYDGIIIEVHPNPQEAWTDAKQQLTWAEFDRLMEARLARLQTAQK